MASRRPPGRPVSDTVITLPGAAQTRGRRRAMVGFGAGRWGRGARSRVERRARTGSSSRSGGAAWPRSTGPTSRPSTATWRSRSCRASSCTTPASPSASSAEAKAIAKLEHPNIVPIYAYDIDEAEGIPWMAMRLVAAGSLVAAAQERAARLPFARSVEILRGVADALDYAHGKGIVHRDVKPQNVLLDEDGRVYLADFGIAKILEASGGLTATGMITGTPQYMAPEQATATKVGPPADVYALGIVAYEMFTGRVPVLRRHAGGDPDEARAGAAAAAAAGHGAGGPPARAAQVHGQEARGPLAERGGLRGRARGRGSRRGRCPRSATRPTVARAAPGRADRRVRAHDGPAGAVPPPPPPRAPPPRAAVPPAAHRRPQPAGAPRRARPAAARSSASALAAVAGPRRGGRRGRPPAARRRRRRRRPRPRRSDVAPAVPEAAPATAPTQRHAGAAAARRLRRPAPRRRGRAPAAAAARRRRHVPAAPAPDTARPRSPRPPRPTPTPVPPAPTPTPARPAAPLRPAVDPEVARLAARSATPTPRRGAAPRRTSPRLGPQAAPALPALDRGPRRPQPPTCASAPPRRSAGSGRAARSPSPPSPRPCATRTRWCAPRPRSRSGSWPRRAAPAAAPARRGPREPGRGRAPRGGAGPRPPRPRRRARPRARSSGPSRTRTRRSGPRPRAPSAASAPRRAGPSPALTALSRDSDIARLPRGAGRARERSAEARVSGSPQAVRRRHEPAAGMLLAREPGRRRIRPYEREGRDDAGHPDGALAAGGGSGARRGLRAPGRAGQRAVARKWTATPSGGSATAWSPTPSGSARPRASSSRAEGEAKDFASIPLGYELKAKGKRRADGSLLAREVEAKPNGSAMFEGEVRSATDQAEAQARAEGPLHRGRREEGDERRQAHRAGARRSTASGTSSTPCSRPTSTPRTCAST